MIPRPSPVRSTRADVFRRSAGFAGTQERTRRATGVAGGPVVQMRELPAAVRRGEGLQLVVAAGVLPVHPPRELHANQRQDAADDPVGEVRGEKALRQLTRRELLGPFFQLRDLPVEL